MTVDVQVNRNWFFCCSLYTDIKELDMVFVFLLLFCTKELIEQADKKKKERLATIVYINEK
jgi:hypothetical protein